MRLQYRRRLREAVEQLITELGPTVGAIAEHLAELGVRGRPGDEEHCALNAYLRCVVGADPVVVGVAVRPHAVHLRVARWRPAVRVPLPLEAQAFIAAFDAGLYPGLATTSAEQPPALTTGVTAQH